MKLTRMFVLAGLASVLGTTVLQAADYYILPQKAGSVVGAPLAAITLQATKTSRLRDSVDQRGNGSAKWVSARKGNEATVSTTETATTTTTTTTSTAPTTTVQAPSGTNSFASFAALAASKKLVAGDKVLFMAGYHGMLAINGQNFSAPVTLMAAPGAVAQVDAIRVTDSSKVVIKDLKVWTSGATSTLTYQVQADANTSDITFQNLDIRAVPDSVNYVSWDLATWTANKRSGIEMKGTRISAIGNRLTGINFGITGGGDSALIEKNIIDGFSGDGMRALGNNVVVRGNRVQNCVKIDGNHADGFQSWSRGPNGPGSGTVYNLVIEGNKFFEWNNPTVSPLKCKLQGVGMFDGMYDGVKVSNNLISSTQYHGIAIAGALNTLINNNTVTAPITTRQNYPWIKIAYHKNGTPSRNVRVSNNTSNGMGVPASTVNNVVTSNNILVTVPSAEFVSPVGQNFALQPTAKSANAGAAAYAPPVDILGVPRPRGSAPDAGAYESF